MADFDLEEFDEILMPSSVLRSSAEDADLDLPSVGDDQSDAGARLPPQLPDSRLLAPSRPPRPDDGASRPSPPPKPASPRREKSPTSLLPAVSPRQKGQSKSAPTSPASSKKKKDQVQIDEPGADAGSSKSDKASKKREPPSPRKKRGLFRGLSTHNVSDSSISRNKSRKRGKTVTDMSSLAASDTLVEVVLKSDWEHANDKTELGQKLQKELVKLDSEKAVFKATTQTLTAQNNRLKTWKAVLEESAREDAALADELERKISEVQREIKTYERLCRDLDAQTKSVKASVQQGVNFLKPYLSDMITTPTGAAPLSPRGTMSPRSPR